MSQTTVRFAVAALAEQRLRPFPPDHERILWWEATQATIDDLATLMPEGQAYPVEGVTQPMFLGYPLHAAGHVEPGYIALCEQLRGIGLAYDRDV